MKELIPFMDKLLNESPYIGLTVGFILGAISVYVAVLKGYIAAPSVRKELAESKAMIASLKRWLEQQEQDLELCEKNLNDYRTAAHKEHEANKQELKALREFIREKLTDSL